MTPLGGLTTVELAIGVVDAVELTSVEVPLELVAVEGVLEVVEGVTVVEVAGAVTVLVIALVTVLVTAG
jgi:hypothetical protein